jgi:hypothetical protein
MPGREFGSVMEVQERRAGSMLETSEGLSLGLVYSNEV